MPATMENLDYLTNDQLRLRLLEVGMSNMPVTSTTRSVLIKRLRNIMDTANSKTRRETVHVTKVSSGDESDADTQYDKTANNKNSKLPTAARRATLAAPIKATTPPPRSGRTATGTPPPQAKAITTRRTSGRITPLADRDSALVGKVAVPTADAPITITEIDEDSDTEWVPLTQPPRKGRASSMGKSDTVVTSYQHTVSSPKPPPIEYDEIVLDDDDEYGSNSDNAEVENSVDAEVRTYNSYSSGAAVVPPNSSYASSAYARTRSTVGHRDSPAPPLTNLSRHAISTSYNTSYRPTDDYPRPSYASTSTFLKSANDTEAIDDLEIDEAPYLSDFTRRLTRLRAEPLVHGTVNIDEQAQSSYEYRPFGRSAAVNRKHDESVWRSFVTMLHTFKRQYGNLIIAFFVVIVAIVLYVVFFKDG